MNKLLVYLLFLSVVMSFQDVSAGEITVIDKITREHIPSVIIQSKNPKIQKYSSTQGRFMLEDFKGADSITISYPNYMSRTFAYRDLHNTVWIELSDVQLDFEGFSVVANRWLQDKSEIAGKIAKLNLKELEMQNVQTAADLLEASGYVFIQKSQLAGGSPELRGFGTNRVMIVVDGVRMNNAIFRSGNLQNVISIDANSLEGVEVLFGPGAVMYGSDAIGGVMDFSTKQAKFSTDSIKNTYKTNLFSRYSSASNEFTSHVNFNYGGKKFAAVTAITYSSFGDLTTGKNGDSYFLRPTYQENGMTLVNPNPRKQIHTGYDQINAIQKFSFKLNENVLLDYGFTYSTNLKNAPRYDRLVLDRDEDGNLDYEEWYYGPQEWMMNRLALSVSKKTKLYDEFKIVTALQNFEESRHDRRFGSDNIRHQYEDEIALSLNADFEKIFGQRATLFYGVEGVFNKVGSKAEREYDDGSTLTINSRYPNGSTWQAYGAYSSLKLFLSDDWILNSGVRYSHYYIEADFDTDLFPYPVESTVNSNGSVNGNLGLIYRPNKRTQVYFNVASGFRAPNIDDLGKVFDSEPGNVVVPNVDLKAETAYNAEIGFVKAIKGKVKLDGAIYYTYLENEMARADYTFNGADSMLYDGTLSQIQAIQNLSEAHIYGFQAGVEVSISKGLTLLSTISYQKGVELDLDSNIYLPKSHVAPMFGRTTLRYKTRQLRMEFYAVYHGQVSAENMPLNERDDANYTFDETGSRYTPSWYTLNLKGSYFFNKHLSLTAGVENITNQLYRTFGSGISSPGTNFLVSLKATF